VLPRRERDVVDRAPVDLRALVFRAVPVFEARPPLVLAALERVPVPVPVDLAAREPVVFARVVFARVVFARVVFARLVFARLDFARVVFARPVLAEPVERDLAALPREVEPLRDPPLLVPDSSDHLPDITSCAASATASAINEPRRVALVITVLAACDAESAASIPASRIFLRADGLALIAAAAAASPAASISLLIAALVILSTVVSFEPREPDDDFRLLDFAIANLPVGSLH
jgi:hypothetical protein